MFRIPPERTAVLACEVALLLYFAMLWAVALAGDKPVGQAWHNFGVYSYDRPFFDLAIVADGIAKAADGLSPLGASVRGGAFPPYNYPRIWLALGKLGLAPDTVFVWGLGLALCFWAGSLAVLKPRTLSHGLVLAALWCSPAFMLGVERANVDLAVFSLLAVTLLLLRRSAALSLPGFLLVAAAKLYPIAAAIALLSVRTRLRWMSFIGVVTSFVGYIWIFRDDIALIAVSTPHDTHMSYGCAIPLQTLNVSFMVAYGSGLLASAVVAIVGIRFAPRLPDVPDRAREALLAGAGIYCGSFLLGNNYEYRLIFLQLCLPGFWFWCGYADVRVRKFAYLCLGLCGLAAWWTLIDRLVPGVAAVGRQLITFGLFAVMATVLATALRAGRQDTGNQRTRIVPSR